jgi:DNA-binding MarR family transcriptional regulator
MAERELEKKEEASAESRSIAIRLERLSRLLRQGGHAEGLVPVHWEILRYLARAGRHSRTPAAVAGFLGLSKGTTSQSLSALSRKGLIVRHRNPDDKRQQSLSLTEVGRSLLIKDPFSKLEAAIADLGGKTRARLDRALVSLLEGQIAQRGLQHFGTCDTCKFHNDGNGKDLCGHDGQPLTASELSLLCIEHQQI